MEAVVTVVTVEADWVVMVAGWEAVG